VSAQQHNLFSCDMHILLHIYYNNKYYFPYIGMKRNFIEFKNFVEASSPQLIGHIRGGIHPPAIHAQYIAQAASVSWFGGIVLLIGGNSIFSALGMAAPYYFNVMKENQVER
jgi:hypothetical protein